MPCDLEVIASYAQRLLLRSASSEISVAKPYEKVSEYSINSSGFVNGLNMVTGPFYGVNQPPVRV